MLQSYFSANYAFSAVKNLIPHPIQKRPQLPQRLGFDLADAFACDRERLSDSFECVFAAGVPQLRVLRLDANLGNHLPRQSASAAKRRHVKARHVSAGEENKRNISALPKAFVAELKAPRQSFKTKGDE